MDTKLTFLKKSLEERGHSPFFIGYQCGLVMAGHRGKELHDDTCNIITSVEWLSL
jgi:hypothetical protein